MRTQCGAVTQSDAGNGYSGSLPAAHANVQPLALQSLDRELCSAFVVGVDVGQCLIQDLQPLAGLVVGHDTRRHDVETVEVGERQ